MFSEIKRFLAENSQGTVFILTLIVVSVFFILTSFLARRVITNTVMVKKMKDEQASYTWAKEGILYAVTQLNTSDEAADWTPADDGITPDEEDWYDYLNRGYSLKVTSDDPSPSYIKVESQDLPKKLVTLEGVAGSDSPLLKYVRFINSDTIFGHNTFGSSESSALVRGEAPFCILGDLTWEGSNNLILNITSGDNTAVVYGDISSSGTLTIDGSPPSTGLYYTDPSDPSDPTLFNTANGHYFDLAHLPSTFDHSTDPPVFHYGNPKSIFWPNIINEKQGETVDNNYYRNLVQTDGIYISGTPVDESSDWYPSSFPPSSGTWSPTYGGTYFYTGSGTLVILDGNGKTSGISGQMGIDDGTGEGTPGDDIIHSDEWRSYPLPPIVSNGNGVIYSPGNIRISGIIGDDATSQDYNLTIVSGGTIYIEGPLIKGTSGSSLALLAKDWVALNSTHRFTGGTLSDLIEENIYGDADWSFDPDPEGQSWGIMTHSGEGITTAVFDLGYPILANRITIEGLTLKEDWHLRIYVSNNASNNTESNPTYVEDNDTLFANTTLIGPIGPPKENKILDHGSPVTFQYIKIWLHITSTAADVFQLQRIVVELTGGGTEEEGTLDGKPYINAVSYAQEESWAVIPGNGTAYAIRIGGCIAENKQEDDSNWLPDWDGIHYVYDDLSSNPPSHLPPSVNLVSLRRK